MSQHPQRQHYVPRFLLKNFSSRDNTYIWCYDTQWNKTKERPINGIAYKHFLYDFKQGDSNESLEHLIGSLETVAAKIITNIINNATLDLLTETDRTIIAMFIALQYIRTPSSLNQSENMGQILKAFEPLLANMHINPKAFG